MSIRHALNRMTKLLSCPSSTNRAAATGSSNLRDSYTFRTLDVTEPSTAVTQVRIIRSIADRGVRHGFSPRKSRTDFRGNPYLASSPNNYSTFERRIRERLNPIFNLQVEINRPQKANAMSSSFFVELKDCFERLAVDPACRAVVLCGSGERVVPYVPGSPVQCWQCPRAPGQVHPQCSGIAGAGTSKSP